MSFVGGKLNLKGGEPLKAAGGVKKKKKKKSKDEAADGGTGEGGGGGSAEKAKPVSKLEGYELPAPSEEEDRRTEAQRRHEARLAKLEEERLKKIAVKGYRDRMKELNEHLASLSEHHDIPRVGPG